MRGNKRTFPNFHLFAFWSPWIQILFKHKTLERRWYDFFHLIKWKGFLKRFEFYLEIFQNSVTLSNSMIFMREDKMTSSKHIKYELEVLKESNLKFLWNYFQFGVIWFYSKYLSPKIKYMENGVKWFPTIEKWREINLKLFWYFKIILFGF